MVDIAQLGFRADSSQVVTATERLDRLGDQAATTERQVRTSGQTATREFRSMGSSLTNLSRTPAFRGISVQLSQVAQQATATGQPMRALAIQAADIGMLFGPMGIAIGVAAGALLPLAENLFAAEDASSELEENLDRLGSAMDALEGPMDIMSMSLSEITQKYGDASLRVRQFAVDLANIRVAEAEAALREQTRLIQDVAEAYRVVQDRGHPLEVAARNTAAVQRIMEDFQLTKDAALDFQAAIEDMGAASSLTQQQIILADMLSLLREAGVATSDIPPEFRSALAAMIETSNAADELRARTEEAAETAEDVAIATGLISFEGAIDGARRLTAQLGIALSAARDLANTGAPGPTDEDLQRAEDMRAYGQGQQAMRDRVAEGYTLPVVRSAGGSRSRGGGGGGISEEAREGQREAAMIMREVERATREAMSAADRYSAEIEDLTGLHEAGYLTAEQYARAVDMIDQEFREAQLEEFERGIESISDAVAQAIVNGEELRETFSRVLAQIAADIISSGIKGLLLDTFSPLSSGGGGGGILGFLSNPFGIGKNANGTDNWRGGLTWVGERGPEIVNLPRGSQVIPSHKAGGMGGGDVHIHHTWNIAANGDESVVRIVRQQAPAIVQASKIAVLDAKRRGGSYGRAF